ncbi:putative anti-sigma factor [Gordonia hirsuta DSM 44140 = NBRC 16056]|uniref:Putative anti-sigma factor n=1 Tax=Gordonia hirsuta DSM 44140 = NBRC 16056 TaxID=1121927 RepID=L7LCK8_9ACTN|nr:mycothiol system anti-sigma-R factor [Gordonia hirsuta]GAC58456.1 putative anti-sigma factor [Gordonia hirsuta DSM 44140 = NBRC 16056]
MTTGDLTPTNDEQLDCSAVLADIFLLLDNECDLDARARLRLHLERCPTCLEHYDVQRELKALLRRKCAEAAPAGLADRLRVEIRRTVVVRQTTIRIENND